MSKLPLEAELRSYVKLSDGKTYFEIFGEDSNPLVVLVHGISTSMFIWDYQINALVRSGYRVLRYDLFGRGLSERPNVKYSNDLYNRQLQELLEHLEIPQPYGLVGLSLGGGIGVNFAALNPDKLQKLGLVAPAGLRQTMPWWFHLATLPGITELAEYGFGKWYWGTLGPDNLTRDPRKRRVARRKMKQQLELDGYHEAMISTLRHGPVYGLRKAYRLVGQSGLPVHAIWSRKDTVVPYRLNRVLRKLVPQAGVTSFRNGTHAINYDRPECVNPSLLGFLERT